MPPTSTRQLISSYYLAKHRLSMANIILCREIGQTRLEKLANQLKFPAKIQNRGERFGRKRKNMYLCRPYMGVRNLPQAQSGDKLRVHKVPLPSIFPSPGQEGRHEYPITSTPLSQAGLRIPPSGSSLPHLTAMHPVFCAMAYYGAVWI